MRLYKYDKQVKIKEVDEQVGGPFQLQKYMATSSKEFNFILHFEFELGMPYY